MTFSNSTTHKRTTIEIPLSEILLDRTIGDMCYPASIFQHERTFGHVTESGDDFEYVLKYVDDIGVIPALRALGIHK